MYINRTYCTLYNNPYQSDYKEIKQIKKINNRTKPKTTKQNKTTTTTTNKQTKTKQEKSPQKKIKPKKTANSTDTHWG